MRELSERTSEFTDSVIRRMTRIANRYGAVNLSQGFPDFDPPKAMTDRLAQVAGEGPHQYALTWGAQNFREALADKYEHFSGIKVDPDSEIVVTCGSTEAMMASMMSVVNPGDKVVIFSPFMRITGLIRFCQERSRYMYRLFRRHLILTRSFLRMHSDRVQRHLYCVILPILAARYLHMTSLR